MSKFEVAFAQQIAGWWHHFWVHLYFKFVLPRIETTIIEGVRLDLRAFSPRVRNRILLGYEQPERNLCAKLFCKDDGILEIGGGIGFISLLCRKNIGVAKYILVEANPMTIEALRRNYELNGLTPVVWNYALSDADGTVELNVQGDFWDHFIVRKHHAGSTNIRVPSATLPTLLAQAPFPVTALIIDIEGAERFINFRELPSSITKLLIEVHPATIGRNKMLEIIDALAQQQFRIVQREGNTFALRRECSPLPV